MNILEKINKIVIESPEKYPISTVDRQLTDMEQKLENKTEDEKIKLVFQWIKTGHIKKIRHFKYILDTLKSK